MVTVYRYQDGKTTTSDQVDPRWLAAGSGATLWVDVAEGTPAEIEALLAGTFGFHPLSVEDALSDAHHPKAETYDGYLYLILHRIDFRTGEHEFATRDVDFFLGPNYLVTVHDGGSRSIERLRGQCSQHAHLLQEGPVALLHRIVDSIIDNYAPELAEIEAQMEQLEEEAILGADDNLVRPILTVKRDLAGLRRVLIPQRDVVGRLARREFPQITDEMAYRFRDVYDHLVRFSDEAAMFQDRVTGILEGYLSAISNRLNRVMKVLTVMSTIFLPLTVLTGMWGMNVRLPLLPGGESTQFWWIAAIMLVVSGAMLVAFGRKRWL